MADRDIYGNPYDRDLIIAASRRLGMGGETARVREDFEPQPGPSTGIPGVPLDWRVPPPIAGMHPDDRRRWREIQRAEEEARRLEARPIQDGAVAGPSGARESPRAVTLLDQILVRSRPSAIPRIQGRPDGAGVYFPLNAMGYTGGIPLPQRSIGERGVVDNPANLESLVAEEREWLEYVQNPIMTPRSVLVGVETPPPMYTPRDTPRDPVWDAPGVAQVLQRAAIEQEQGPALTPRTPRTPRARRQLPIIPTLPLGLIPAYESPHPAEVQGAASERARLARTLEALDEREELAGIIERALEEQHRDVDDLEAQEAGRRNEEEIARRMGAVRMREENIRHLQQLEVQQAITRECKEELARVREALRRCEEGELAGAVRDGVEHMALKAEVADLEARLARMGQEREGFVRRVREDAERMQEMAGALEKERTQRRDQARQFEQERIGFYDEANKRIAEEIEKRQAAGWEAERVKNARMVDQGILMEELAKCKNSEENNRALIDLLGNTTDRYKAALETAEARVAQLESQMGAQMAAPRDTRTAGTQMTPRTPRTQTTGWTQTAPRTQRTGWTQTAPMAPTRSLETQTDRATQREARARFGGGPPGPPGPGRPTGPARQPAPAPAAPLSRGVPPLAAPLYPPWPYYGYYPQPLYPPAYPLYPRYPPGPVGPPLTIRVAPI